MVRRHRCSLLPTSAAFVITATLLLSWGFNIGSACQVGGLSRKRGMPQHRRLQPLSETPAPPSQSLASSTTMRNIPRKSRSRKPTNKQDQVSFGRRIPPTASNPTQNRSKPRNNGSGDLKNMRGRRR